MLRSMMCALVATTLLAGPALAQRGFEDSAPTQPNQRYQGNQGFSFQGDEIGPSYDRKYLGRNGNDPRYSQTQQEQVQKAQQQPGGGCLRYGAVGAAGGHLAGHGVLGALAGCAVGHYVRKRDQRQIQEQQGVR